MTTAGHEYEKTAPAVEPTAVETPARGLALTLAGVSSDQARLLLAADDGATFTLDITPSLRAALRSEGTHHSHPTRPGQPGQEKKMDSVLRPRDIQARIRAGETPEAVAEAAQTSVDKIMSFVAPVLAERQHVAERAQRSNVRRPAGESGHSRTLGDAVAAHLRSLNVDPDVVAWDASRREDGRWAVTAGIALPVRTGTAHFVFDGPGNYVVLDGEDARWLIGEDVVAPAPARDDLRSVRERRMSSPRHDEELPLGDDAIELVSDSPLEAFLDESPDSDDPELRHEAEDAAADEPDPVVAAPPASTHAPVEQPMLEEPVVDEPVAEQPVVDEPVVEEPAVEEPRTRRSVQKKRGRASVPSWDEIMFGGGDQ
ncbi:DUF3071 domain-containing protein [Nocardioides dongxiaopingii]|uniref:septation protein SepH n=1 Tax=Nocardioides sp. S-1144 TaxID=2582905 RepID=UPI00110EBEC8|nr:septation protein SepH [Nocardioides sp. S-1144]QCW50856.1 DUF3071 domain-containing protein [Nocardioides sp. S-1144]